MRVRDLLDVDLIVKTLVVRELVDVDLMVTDQLAVIMMMLRNLLKLDMMVR